MLYKIVLNPSPFLSIHKYLYISSTLLFRRHLILDHSNPTFNHPYKECFGKHCRKRRKCQSLAFSPFPAMFSTPSKREIVILAMYNLSSANGFKLVKFKILLFGNRLSKHRDCFRKVVSYFEPSFRSCFAVFLQIISNLTVSNVKGNGGGIKNSDFVHRSAKLFIHG